MEPNDPLGVLLGKNDRLLVLVLIAGIVRLCLECQGLIKS